MVAQMKKIHLNFNLDGKIRQLRLHTDPGASTY